jgi:integrase
VAEIAKRSDDITEEQWSKVKEFNREKTEEFLLQGHLSPHTIRQYESALKIFFVYVHDKFGNLPLHQLKPKHALQYQNYLMSRDMASSAVKLKRSAVSSLCGYLELYYNDEFPLFRNIYSKQIPNPPKAFRHEKKPLTPDEIAFLISELAKRNEWQMLAYVQYSYDTASRRGETRQLLKTIVDSSLAKDKSTGEDKKYYYTHDIRAKGKGKTGKVRKFTFDETTRLAVAKWLEVRRDDDCPFVFVTKTKAGKVNQASLSLFNNWCGGLFSEIIGRRVHPHQLRSSRATNLVLYENKDIEKVKGLLGHLSSETTKIYVVKEGEDDVDDLYD